MTKHDDDDAVERRARPRAPVPGLSAAILDGAPLAGGAFPLAEVGLESFFLEGEQAATCRVGQRFRLTLRWHEQEVECAAECVRTSGGPPRVGAVLKLGSGEAAARRLLADVLKPAAVPRDAD
jgi:hypothetical protein